MRYIVKSVVCDYGVYQKKDDKEKLIDICNSKSNAELIADILNTDLKNERYEVVKKSNIDKALEITYKVREMVLHSNRTYEANDVLDIIDEISACFERHIGE